MALAMMLGELLERAETALDVVPGKVFGGNDVGLGKGAGEEGGDHFEGLHAEGEIAEFFESACRVCSEGGEEG